MQRSKTNLTGRSQAHSRNCALALSQYFASVRRAVQGVRNGSGYRAASPNSHCSFFECLNNQQPCAEGIQSIEKKKKNSAAEHLRTGAVCKACAVNWQHRAETQRNGKTKSCQPLEQRSLCSASDIVYLPKADLFDTRCGRRCGTLDPLTLHSVDTDFGYSYNNGCYIVPGGGTNDMRYDLGSSPTRHANVPS